MVFTNFCLFFYKTHQVGMFTRARGSLPMVLEGPPCPSLSLQNLLTLPQGLWACVTLLAQDGRGGEGWGMNAHGAVLPSRMTIPWLASPCWATV